MSIEKMFVLIVDVVVGFVGFGLSILWGKVTGRDMDRDTVLFLGKLWGGDCHSRHDNAVRVLGFVSRSRNLLKK
jgi:hypothetical protein